MEEALEVLQPLVELEPVVEQNDAVVQNGVQVGDNGTISSDYVGLNSFSDYTVSSSLNDVFDDSESNRTQSLLQIELKIHNSIVLTLVKRQLLDDIYCWTIVLSDGNDDLALALIKISEDGKCIVTCPLDEQVLF